MKKDIPIHKVKDLAIAIVPREFSNQEDEIEVWDTYIINLKDEAITGVLISSKGYGEIDGENKRTTTLRHFFEEIGPKRAYPVEPIPTNLFGLTNEYWVSFMYNGHMYDKKYIFVIGSLASYNFTNVPLIEKKGVMIL